MVTKYGMSEKLGMVSYDESAGEVFIGRDFERTRNYSENVATKIDDEVADIIRGCYAKARDIIGQNREILEKCAALLLEKEKIGRSEFEALFDS